MLKVCFKLVLKNYLKLLQLSVPYLTFAVGRLLHLPSAEVVSVWPNAQQRRSQEFDLGGYKLHDIEFVLGQGDKTTT